MERLTPAKQAESLACIDGQSRTAAAPHTRPMSAGSHLSRGGIVHGRITQRKIVRFEPAPEGVSGGPHELHLNLHWSFEGRGKENDKRWIM